MDTPFRTHSPLDKFLSVIDQGLRSSLASTGKTITARRPMPTPQIASPVADLSPSDRALSARLMRVNHAGEVAAQALYQGQALVALEPATREFMLQSAREEADHLAWCTKRLADLGAEPSRLNPLWYLGSFTIGATVGLVGRRFSLGFVKETEVQVEGHLNDHLTRLPAEDTASRAVLLQMREDENRHGMNAVERGASDLPEPVRALMRLTAKVMTLSAERI